MQLLTPLGPRGLGGVSASGPDGLSRGPLLHQRIGSVTVQTQSGEPQVG